jgi:hypothetical protein
MSEAPELFVQLLLNPLIALALKLCPQSSSLIALTFPGRYSPGYTSPEPFRGFSPNKEQTASASKPIGRVISI